MQVLVGIRGDAWVRQGLYGSALGGGRHAAAAVPVGDPGRASGGVGVCLYVCGKVREVRLRQVGEGRAPLVLFPLTSPAHWAPTPIPPPRADQAAAAAVAAAVRSPGRSP